MKKNFTVHPKSKVNDAVDVNDSRATLKIVLEVDMEKYDPSGDGEFEFSVDTNDIGEAVLTPYDNNIHFTGIRFVEKSIL